MVDYVQVCSDFLVNNLVAHNTSGTQRVMSEHQPLLAAVFSLSLGRVVYEALLTTPTPLRHSIMMMFNLRQSLKHPLLRGV